MLKNYFKIAFRNFKKRRGYAFINVAGLAVGMACCLLIALFVRHERSYDRYHEHADRIFRLVEERARVGAPFAPALLNEFPEVEQAVRLHHMFWTTPLLQAGERGFYEDRIFFADSSLFDVFSFRLLRGDPKTALAAPFSMILTEAMAAKYFGDADPMGQVIAYDNTHTYTVTGIVENTPPPSHFRFDFLASFSTLYVLEEFWGMPLTWTNPTATTYLLLSDPDAAEALEARLPDFIVKHRGEAFRNGRTFHLQPLTDIHLHSNRRGEFGPNGDIAYVYIFSAIALFILFIACFNFINLSTARSMERAREVGMRKVMGSSRGLLIRQFLSESVVMCGFAFVLALGIIVAALPYFSGLAGKEMTFSMVLNPTLVLSVLGLTLLVGLLAGSYPAFVFSGFPAIEVLKGVFHSSAKGGMLRKGLVVFQFTLSIALIASTAVVFDQLAYMRGQDLGFDKEQVLVVDARNLPTDVMQRQHETVKAEFMQHPSIQHASASMSVPGQSTWLQVIFAEGLDENDSRRVQLIPIDDNYVETLGIEMAAGRDFSPEFMTDQDKGVLVNEAAVESIGWGTPEDAVGKTINFGGDQDLRVVGVIKNYHHDSFKETLEPMLFLVYPQAFRYFSVRLDKQNMPESIAHLEQAWKALFPGYAFESFFLDADLDEIYESEQNLSAVVRFATLLAIFIACLGLFGLASFTAEQRTKEIGVRKTLGASVTSIVLLLSKEFTKLVVVAFAVAAPVAYFAMDQWWLQDFAYRIDISWPIFLMAGLSALVIAWLTVSYQSVKAALTNPVEALRYE
ncbi:MAG: ABC transporter permease [Bacteroidetes bacterium]|nr:ABC transporter permease [Bacteroidota bacterium]